MNNETRPPTTQEIIQATSRHFGIPTITLLDTSNHHGAVVYARHIAMYLSHTVGFQSYAKAAKGFGVTNSTIMYGCRQTEKSLHTANTKMNVRAILNELKP